MTAAIALVIALIAGQSIGAALGGLSIAQLIGLSTFGVQVGVQGIQLGANFLAHLPPPQRRKVLRAIAKHNHQVTLCFQGAPNGQSARICDETH